jgi:hypothetical protein
MRISWHLLVFSHVPLLSFLLLLFPTFLTRNLSFYRFCLVSCLSCATRIEMSFTNDNDCRATTSCFGHQLVFTLFT